MSWRQAGQPIHISALRRITRQTAIFSDPANTAELKLQASDLVAVTAGHHPHTGATGHAVARRTPVRIVEVSASWHRHIQQRDIFPGVQITDRAHTAMMAMTGTALDVSTYDADNLPTLDPDTNPLYSRRQRAAIASYSELKRQKAAIANPRHRRRLPVVPTEPQKARSGENPAEPTNATSPTASYAECGATNEPENNSSHTPLDKGG